MTTEVKNEILKLKSEGKGYGEIAKLLNLQRSTVAKFVQNAGTASKVYFTSCPVCGKEFKARKGPKAKRFCSKECKDKWWNTDRLNRRKTYTLICNHCGKAFKATDKNAKYCCLKCYWNERYGK